MPKNRRRMKPQITDNWPQRGTRFFRIRTHVALTGICRSDGSADTLIREFIRVSGCPPIHVRIADSVACHSSPTNFLFFCRFLFFCIFCIFVANFFPSPHRHAARTSGFISGALISSSISVHPCSSVVPLVFNTLSCFLNFKCRF